MTEEVALRALQRLSYNPDGSCKYPNNEWGNDPRVIGCWADM
jgi:hypothetical protein